MHRQGHHQGVRAHVLDWPAFLREAYSADHLTQLLRIVYEREWAAAKTKHAGKLVNAQKTMELGETIELILELGPDACHNTAAVAGVSSMRKPTNHAPVPAADICRALLHQLVARVDDLNVADGSPSLSLAEIKKPIKDLKDAAAKNLKRKRGPKNNTPGRDQEGEGEEEEQGQEDEPEAPHAAKRVRIDQDLRKSLTDDYIYRLLGAGPSLLNEELSSSAPFDDPTALTASDSFGFGPDVSAASLVAPPGCRGAQLVAARQDTEAELDALVLGQHRQDEVVREQPVFLTCYYLLYYSNIILK
ncbi:uncharacterized protein LY79DRAFT_675456 [Colletotrichum navitas]|uniref:Uncharacterized protein n=1 Tax=Colletotrichum navitas TaxID=681940 RepID=A0AAD8PIP7_9PEZI|nr:uncharacterized protein LY79DRAFT_675456 [Colletotrichum navitas]KAK1561551.1 hypothetical protein LY79DRAFT_675456 [Colletotrichum navitas]